MPSAAFERMPAERRDLLLRTAAREFAAAGYERASLNRVIRVCGLSKSSFYHVISSKEELFDVVVRDLGAALATAVAIPSPDEFRDGRFWARTERLLADIAAASADDAFLALGRMFSLSTPDDAAESVRSALAAIESWLDSVLAIGREHGDVRDDLPIGLQRTVTFAVLRAMDDWTLANAADLDPRELERLVDAQFATLRRLLAP